MLLLLPKVFKKLEDTNSIEWQFLVLASAIPFPFVFCIQWSLAYAFGLLLKNGTIELVFSFISEISCTPSCTTRFIVCAKHGKLCACVGPWSSVIIHISLQSQQYLQHCHLQPPQFCLVGPKEQQFYSALLLNYHQYDCPSTPYSPIKLFSTHQSNSQNDLWLQCNFAQKLTSSSGWLEQHRLNSSTLWSKFQIFLWLPGFNPPPVQ